METVTRASVWSRQSVGKARCAASITATSVPAQSHTHLISLAAEPSLSISVPATPATFLSVTQSDSSHRSSVPGRERISCAGVSTSSLAILSPS